MADIQHFIDGKAVSGGLGFADVFNPASGKAASRVAMGGAREVEAAVASAQKAFYQPTGTDALTSTPEGLARFQSEESRKWGVIVKSARIEPE